MDEIPELIPYEEYSKHPTYKRKPDNPIKTLNLLDYTLDTDKFIKNLEMEEEHIEIDECQTPFPDSDKTSQLTFKSSSGDETPHPHKKIIEKEDLTEKEREKPGLAYDLASKRMDLFRDIDELIRNKYIYNISIKNPAYENTSFDEYSEYVFNCSYMSLTMLFTKNEVDLIAKYKAMK